MRIAIGCLCGICILSSMTATAASISALQTAVAAGDPVANVELAAEYLSGVQVPKNPQMAERLLESASSRGLRSATRELAKLYIHQGKTSVGYQLLFQAARQLDSEAEYLYGRYQLTLDRPSAKVPLSVIRMLESASDHGSADAMYLLYQIHNEGQGVPLDKSLANYWLVRSARAGGSEALQLLGRRAYAENPEKASATLAEQAENGDIMAMLRLASILHDGTYVPKDLVQSMKWLHRAAEAGSPEAAFQLGLLYSGYESSVSDDAEAFRYMLAAAQAGIPAAKSLIGQFYANGRGAEIDPITGLAWIIASEADDAGPGISAPLNRNLRLSLEDYIGDEDLIERSERMALQLRRLAEKPTVGVR